MSDNRRNLSQEQFRKQRKNILHVCRCAIKSLLDASCDHPVNEDSEEVQNLLGILEHVYSHRLKAPGWISSSEPRRFWDFVKVACKSMPHSCVSNIDRLDYPRTSQGKGRAWLQLCLIEKRSSEYMSEILMQHRLLKNYYHEGALMLSDDAPIIAGMIIGLNSLDFSFDVRNPDLDFVGLPVVDFTPYLKFEHSDFPHEALVETSTGFREIDSDDLNSEFWRTKCSKMDEQYRVLKEQKSYLEELVRFRESQIVEYTSQRDALEEKIRLMECDRKKEKLELESIIIELQRQMCHIEAENWSLNHKLQVISKHHGIHDLSAIAMSHLLSAEREEENEEEQRMASQEEPSIDSQSLLSAHSLLTKKTASKEDNQSVLALAGSYSSLASHKSANENPPDKLPANGNPSDNQSANDCIPQDLSPDASDAPSGNEATTQEEQNEVHLPSNVQITLGDDSATVDIEI